MLAGMFTTPAVLKKVSKIRLEGDMNR